MSNYEQDVEVGDWSSHDNKRYIGKIDRIYVSMTEDYEVDYFVDSYLKSRKYRINNSNRDIVTKALEQYEGKKPYRRDDLQAFLDKCFGKA